MLQFLTVTKKYSPTIAALEEVSFEVNEGEFVFFVGPSGSGKTTIIRLLIREEMPSGGKIFFDNEDITKYNRSKIYRLRRKIGVIFQDFKLIPELTAYENVAFAMEAAGRSEKEIKENVPYLLDIVNLTDRMKSFPGQLSGGEKQRVAIARAMANNPKLLIADEPTGNLDPDSAWDIVQILSKINNWGTTVIMSTHGSDIVNTLHKRVLRLENGRLIRDDYKGSYNKIDEFSIKILSAQAGASTENIKTEKVTSINDSQMQVALTPHATKSGKLKQEKSKTKITFSTKKSKKLTGVKPEFTDAEIDKIKDKNFADKMLETISADITQQDALDKPITELEISSDLKKALADLEIITLADLQKGFKPNIRDNKQFSKADKAVLKKLLAST